MDMKLECIFVERNSQKPWADILLAYLLHIMCKQEVLFNIW